MIGRLDAALWTGIATAFSVETSDQLLTTFNVVRRIPERMPVPH